MVHPCADTGRGRVHAQSVAGFDQHVQVSTTKWATSLRNVGALKNDPYGRRTMSVVVGHKEKQQARAVESMLQRVMERYPLDDPKVAGTINAFREHVTQPSMDDLSQLDDVLADYVRRKRQRQEAKRGAISKTLAASARRNILDPTPAAGSRDALHRSRAGSSAGGALASDRSEASKRGRRPLGSAQSDSAQSRLYLVVRKDEWYAVRFFVKLLPLGLLHTPMPCCTSRARTVRACVCMCSCARTPPPPPPARTRASRR